MNLPPLPLPTPFPPPPAPSQPSPPPPCLPAVSRYMCKVPAAQTLYESVPAYISHIEELVPWHESINLMRKKFVQFCIANKKLYKPEMFATDANIGTFAIDVTVVAAYLSWLRFTNVGKKEGFVKKVPTLHNLWQQTRSGLRTALAPGTHRPDWLSCFRLQNTWEVH